MNKYKAIQLASLIQSAYKKKLATTNYTEIHLEMGGFVELIDFEVSAGEFVKGQEWFGFIAEDEECLAVVIPGTTTFTDWTSNLDVKVIPNVIGNNCGITEGVYDLMLQIESQILSAIKAVNLGDKPVYITGHSLGGAVAENIFFRNGWRFKECYSFASPKSRTHKIEPFTDLYRVVNRYDVVPELPENVPGFLHLEHSGIQCELVWNSNNIIENHSINNYVKLLNG